MGRKNILFFFTDQQRKDTLGCYGNKVVQTPNADRLADEGVLFTRAYTPSSICTPARGSLVTGMKPSKHKLIANPERNVGNIAELDEIPGNIPFSHDLREAGYRVGNIGKWHVGTKKGPEDYGFEGEHYPGWGETYQNPHYLNYLEERGLPGFKAHSHIRGTFPNGTPGLPYGGILEQPLEATYTYFLAEKTIEKLRDYARTYKENGTPFYLGMFTFGPHLPYYVPEAYANMYNPDDVKLPEGFKETFENKPRVQRNYADHWCCEQFDEQQWKKIIAMYWGFATLVDEQIGRVMDVLRELGLENDTMIVFSTDHGSFEGSHKMADKGPAMYEDTYNIPFLVKYPGGRRGERDDRLVSLLDLTATFVEEATGAVPERYDGVSLRGLLAGGGDGEPWRDRIFAEFHGHHFPYPQRMIRTDRYKLIVNPADICEFYDLLNDPNELVNEIDNPVYCEQIAFHFEALMQHLIEKNDNFHKWMGTMYPVVPKKENAEE